MTVATYQWTIDRYHQAVHAGVFKDQSVELLNGEIVVISPEGEPHTYFSDWLRQAPKDGLAKRLLRLRDDEAQVREG